MSIDTTAMTNNVWFVGGTDGTVKTISFESQGSKVSVYFCAVFSKELKLSDKADEKALVGEPGDSIEF